MGHGRVDERRHTVLAEVGIRCARRGERDRTHVAGAPTVVRLHREHDATVGSDAHGAGVVVRHADGDAHDPGRTEGRQQRARGVAGADRDRARVRIARRDFRQRDQEAVVRPRDGRPRRREGARRDLHAPTLAEARHTHAARLEERGPVSSDDQQTPVRARPRTDPCGLVDEQRAAATERRIRRARRVEASQGVRQPGGDEARARGRHRERAPLDLEPAQTRAREARVEIAARVETKEHALEAAVGRAREQHQAIVAVRREPAQLEAARQMRPDVDVAVVAEARVGRAGWIEPQQERPRPGVEA